MYILGVLNCVVGDIPCENKLWVYKIASINDVKNDETVHNVYLMIGLYKSLSF